MLPPAFIVRARLMMMAMAAISAMIWVGSAQGAEDMLGFDHPIHGYWTQPPQDRFTRFQADVEAGRRSLDTSGELPFLQSVLQHLEIPVTSQMLVFSATSLQKALISPRRPRAIYFNDDTYVGYVPGGRIEVTSLDPHLGGIFFIFDGLRGSQTPRIERSDRCMTCHAPHYMEGIPGLVVESVVPGITGGGEKAFRREQSGHGIPLDLRFGGWHVTGAPALLKHWGNLFLEYTPEGRRDRAIQPGEIFDLRRYPVTTSDILPHLLHEHQVGFANRAIQSTYRTRAWLKTPGQKAETLAPLLDEEARELVRYLLFAKEAPLPQGGIGGDPAFRAAFTAGRVAAKSGVALKDLDLTTRLLRHRCSYMIYSPAFTGLPPLLKSRVYHLLGRVLGDSAVEPEFAYLPQDERRAIREILRDTLGDLPAGWSAPPALSAVKAPTLIR